MNQKICARIGSLFILFALATQAAADTPKPADQPNILIIVSDDQGYADIGFQGCKDIPTPHLDRLAGEGLRFSNGYVTHAFCSPSRAACFNLGRPRSRTMSRAEDSASKPTLI